MIKLTMTEKQAAIVSAACEFYARIRIGQFGEIAWLCCPDHFPADRDAFDAAWLELRKHIYPELSGVGHSYGVGKFEDSDLSYDVHQVLRHALGDSRRPWSTRELPKCEVRTDEPTPSTPPCDIGDVFYTARFYGVSAQMDIVAETVSGLTKKADGTWKVRLSSPGFNGAPGGVYEVKASEIGTKVFRTPEEARERYLT